MNDFSEIKERVKDSVNLADWVSNAGVRLAGGPVEFKGLCPFHSEKTASFSVNVEKRIWHCFGCSQTGDVFDFEMKRKGLDFMSALKLVANVVGVSVPEKRMYQPPEVRAAAAPQRGVFDPDKFRALEPGGKVWSYLTEKRKLQPETMERYSVGQTVDGQAYSFAYKWWLPGYKYQEGDRPRFEFAKVVKVDRKDGKKEEWREPKGGKNILFGMVAVPKHATELVIAEGEIDAITWAQYGYAAVSVPGGAGYLGWLEICWDWLERFKKIHISFDEDAAGRKKLVELVQRLGMARTDIVHLPEKAPGIRYKDANECLQGGVTRETMVACVNEPEVLKPAALKDIYAFENEIWEKLHPEGTDQLGLRLPWGNQNGSSLPFRFRYGEVTVWTGFNKHGKSEVLNNCIVDLCWQGDKALICSLEVQAPETYRKLIRMAIGRRDVCAKEDRAHFRERCLKPLAQKVWVYDHVGNAVVTDVLNVMLYAFQRYGCRQFVLDSLMKFQGLDGEGQEQWNHQRDFMNAVITFAATYRVHVHLVAHSKKPDKQGEAKIPRRYDISGSAHISNLPHNVLVVWRNRAKQDKLEELFQTIEEEWAKRHPTQPQPCWKRLMGGPPPKDATALRALWNQMCEFVKNDVPAEVSSEFAEVVAKHDGYFIVDAQRGGDGDCPARHLFFHYDSLQFIEASPWNNKLVANDPRKQPKEYVQQLVMEMDEEL
jgi:twinkle protein